LAFFLASILIRKSAFWQFEHWQYLRRHSEHLVSNNSILTAKQIKRMHESFWKYLQSAQALLAHSTAAPAHAPAAAGAAAALRGGGGSGGSGG
jgi:hypothetical protein